MSQLSLDGVRSFGVHDPLGRCYTPQRLADAIVAAIEAPSRVDTVIEPSVGGGAFARAVRKRWTESHLIGVDLDPDAEGSAECDEWHVGNWIDRATTWVQIVCRDPAIARPSLILGNPDFGRRDPSVPLAHTEAALSLRPRVLAFILPWAYWGVGVWTPLLWGDRRPAVCRPIQGRPWEVVREVAVYEWHLDERPAFTRIEPLTGWPA